MLSFGKYAQNAAPDVMVTLIQTFVEHIYITDENDERHCHIFIKGCSKEDYDDFFRAIGYIENSQETELSHLFCLCVIQNSVANTRKYCRL